MKHCIILHLYYQDLWPEFKEKILPLLSDSMHLYVSIVERTQYTADIEQHATEVFLVENRGMDYGPFVFIYDKIRNMNYDYIVKLHGKKSLHTPGIGDIWRTGLVNSLIETPDQFNQIVEYMKTDSSIYMASGAEFYHDSSRESVTHPNYIKALPYIDKVRTYINSDAIGSFYAGSMFIVSTEYLEKLFHEVDLMQLYNQFEPGYLSNSFAHGMERVIGYGVAKHGGQYLNIS